MGPYIYSEFSKHLGQQFSKFENLEKFEKYEKPHAFQVLFPRIHKDKAVFLTVLNGVCLFHHIDIFSAVTVRKQW